VNRNITLTLAAFWAAFFMLTAAAHAYTVDGGDARDREIIAEAYGRIAEPVYGVVDEAHITVYPEALPLLWETQGAFAYAFSGNIGTKSLSKAEAEGHHVHGYLAHELAHVLDSETPRSANDTRPGENKEAFADSFAAYIYPDFGGAYGYPLEPEEAWAWAVTAATPTTTAPPVPVLVPSLWPDLPSGAEYQAAGEWAKTEGVFLGRSDGLLDPHTPITRGEMLLVLYRMASSK